MNTPISIKTLIQAPLERVWKCWTHPEHIIHWNFATEEWHCPEAKNNLEQGGKFSWRMEARDGSMGFDYSGTYNKIEINKSIDLTLDDGRKVSILFSKVDGFTQIEETFEPENQNDLELQKQGWEAILKNFKKYVESL